jgi:hypothetical protein
MRNQEWDAALAQLDSLHFSQFVLGFLGGNSVDCETTLGVVDKSEVLSSFVNGNDIHEASGVGDISSYFAVDFDQTLHDDCFGLSGVEGIL